MTLKPTFVLCFILFWLCGCSISYDYTIGEQPVTQIDNYFEEKAKPVNSLLVFGPQPEQSDLSTLKDHHIQKVISFRTPKEIQELDYEQAMALQDLGIKFANIPIGGDDYPYSPAAYESLVSELAGIDSKNGRVLLHCKSGWRASVVGVAYLVKHQGMAMEEAVEYAVGWWPLPLEKVLDTELVLQEK